MSDMNLVIRGAKERQPRLGIAVGCVLALACCSTESISAQVVQVAGENHSEILGVPAHIAAAQLTSAESGRLTSRRAPVKLPQKGEPSPSDSKQDAATPDDKRSVQDAKVDGSAQENLDDVKDDVISAMKSSTQDTGKGITPMQAAGLKLSVDRVNISTNTIGTGVLPDDTAAKRAPPSTSLLDGQSRGIVAQQVNWKPSAVCHLPLYFEDAMLERHGHVRWGCAQPVVSGAKFLATMPLLPYITTLQPPLEPRYALGHFRPGSCAPALKDHLPWDRRAATVEVISLGAFFWAAPL